MLVFDSRMFIVSDFISSRPISSHRRHGQGRQSRRDSSTVNFEIALLQSSGPVTALPWLCLECGSPAFHRVRIHLIATVDYVDEAVAGVSPRAHSRLEMSGAAAYFIFCPPIQQLSRRGARLVNGVKRSPEER